MSIPLRHTLSKVMGLALVAAVWLPTGAQAGLDLSLLDRIAQLQRDGDLGRAIELAERVSLQMPGLAPLVDQLEAERDLSLGRTKEALERLRAGTPPGRCLVSFIPSYRNSCRSMSRILRELGDLQGLVEMLRRQALGGEIDGAAPLVRLYLDLAVAYEDLGDSESADAFDRTVLHCFNSEKEARQALDALEGRDAPTGDPDEVILLNALSTDPVLARAGRAALRRLADPAAALDYLMRAAASHPDTRLAELELMAALPLDDLESRLHQILHEGDPTEREIADGALRIRTGLSYPRVSEDGEVLADLDRTSLVHGQWATPFLREMAEDPYEWEPLRLMALEAMGQMNDPAALEPILAMIDHAKPAWRLHALRALTAHKGERVETALVQRTSDPDPMVRLTAAAGLARRDLADAPDRLAQMVLTEDHPLVAAALVEALGSLPSAGALDRLGDAVELLEGMPAAKAGAVLWQAGDPRGRRLLERALEEPPPASRWAAAALAAGPGYRPDESRTPLLDELVPPVEVLAAPETLGSDPTPREILLASLLGVQPPDRVAREMLDSGRWSDYRPVALAVANSGARHHLDAVRRLARASRYDPDGRERVTYNENALRVLGWLQDAGSLTLFREVVASSAFGGPRVVAAWALGRLQDHESIPLLVDMFVDPDTPYRVRRAAAQALSHFDDPALGALILGQLESPDPDIRRLTILLLADTGSRVGGEFVEHIAQADPDPAVRETAEALGTLIH